MSPAGSKQKAEAGHVHLVVGDDPYLVDQAIGEISGGASAIDVEDFGPDSDLSAIREAMDTPSLFGGVRTVVVRGVDDMTAEAQRDLVGMIQEGVHASLVLVSQRPLPKLAETVRKVGRVTDASRGKRSDVFGWLREEAKRRGLRVAGDAFGTLVEMIGDERMALVQALDELGLVVGSGGQISSDDVRRQFRGGADVRAFAFIDAVASRRAGPALEALQRLLRQGEAPQALFWTLTRHFRMLLLAAEMKPSEAAKTLGLPAWRAEKLVDQARNFSGAELADAYQRLAEADRKMKKSEEPEALTLERVAVAISAR